MLYINKTSILQLSDTIKGSSVISIVAHTNPDGDALGSCLGLLYYLDKIQNKDCMIILPDPIPAKLEFLTHDILNKRLFFYSESRKAVEKRISKSDLIFCLDCNGFSRTSQGFEHILRKSNASKILIDHHPEPDSEAFNLVFSKTDISSASELVYYILLSMPDINGDNKRLPKESGTALMTGMTTDTNNFSNSVYPSTFEMASSLLSAGIDRESIINNIYNSADERRIRLMGYLLSEKLKIMENGAAYIILDSETQKKFNYQKGDNDGFVNIPLTIKKVKISLFILEEDGAFRISLRSKKGISSNECAKIYFYGGGHEQASGGRLCAKFKGEIQTPEQISEYVEKSLNNFLG